jgi:hypothetical protein
LERKKDKAVAVVVKVTLRMKEILTNLIKSQQRSILRNKRN